MLGMCTDKNLPIQYVSRYRAILQARPYIEFFFFLLNSVSMKTVIIENTQRCHVLNICVCVCVFVLSGDAVADGHVAVSGG